MTSDSDTLPVSTESLRIGKVSDHNYYMWKTKIMLELAILKLNLCIRNGPLDQSQNVLKGKERKLNDSEASAANGLPQFNGSLEHVRKAQVQIRCKILSETFVSVTLC